MSMVAVLIQFKDTILRTLVIGLLFVDFICSSAETIVATHNKTDIRCLSGEKCLIHCGFDEIDDRGYCEFKSIHCPNSADCTVNCTQKDACRSSTINCPTTGICDIYCTDFQSCYQAIITCPKNANCNIDCSGDKACNYASVTWSPYPYKNSLNCGPNCGISLPPTSAPTQTTIDPSFQPTATPITNIPSFSPSKSPSENTWKPTSDPTVAPTLQPTTAPITNQPTLRPMDPSSNPTAPPTSKPTTSTLRDNPTFSPTDNPTFYRYNPTAERIHAVNTPTQSQIYEQSVADEYETTQFPINSHLEQSRDVPQKDSTLFITIIVILGVIVCIMAVLYVTKWYGSKEKEPVPMKLQDDEGNIAQRNIINSEEEEINLEMAEVPGAVTNIAQDESSLSASDTNEGLYMKMNTNTTIGMENNDDDGATNDDEEDGNDKLYDDARRTKTRTGEENEERRDTDDTEGENVDDMYLKPSVATKTTK